MRLTLGLSAHELARRMGGRHYQTVHKLERGDRASELVIYQAARELGVPARELIREDIAA